MVQPKRCESSQRAASDKGCPECALLAVRCALCALKAERALL